MIRINEALSLPESELDVVAIGESVVDLISDCYDSPLDNVVYRRYFGGSTGNVAINLSKLGCKVRLISNIGTDALGKFLLETLKRNKVDTEGISMDSEHRTSVVIVNKYRGQVKFSPHRDADMYMKISDNEIRLCENAKFIHFSTWPLSHGTSRNNTMSLLQSAKDKGRLLCLDPNYRHILWEKGHNGVEYIKKVIGIADIVKPSAVDARHLFGEGSNEYYVDRFLELGAGLVILTLGSEGAIVSDGTSLKYYDSFDGEVADTIGAGDAFWAGFYAALLRVRTVDQAVRTGMAVSTYALKTIGSLPELPTFEEIERKYLL
jgi:fructokinase